MTKIESKHIDKILKSFLGFSDWFITRHSINDNRQIVDITIGRWRGHELIEFKLTCDN